MLFHYLDGNGNPRFVYAIALLPLLTPWFFYFIAALNELVRTIIDPMGTGCGETISSYCVFWTNYIKDTNDPTAVCVYVCQY